MAICYAATPMFGVHRFAVWLVGCAMVAGCNQSASSDDSAAASPTQEPTAPPKQIDELPEVDVSGLDGPTLEIWVELVNDLLSPCGDPVSVARCVAEKRKCRRCVPAARYVARLVDEGYQRGEIRELYRMRYDKSTKVKLSAKGSAVRGAAMAPVTIIEFSDFECPHCRMAAPELKRVLEQYEGKVRLVFKHFPLSQHEHSMQAAIAAEAAGKQGKFWEMHDLLFENQTRLEPSDIEKYAADIKLDLKKFKKDLRSDKIRAKVEADRADGIRVQVASTPSIFIDGRRYELPTDAIGDYIREELD